MPDENPQSLGVVTFNLRFPGQYYDPETILHYNYFRDYDPTTGRYIESDPIGLEGGVNTYAYGEGNPLKNIDPDRMIIPLPKEAVEEIINRLRCLLAEAEAISGDPQSWVKCMEKGPSGGYRCRYVISVNPPPNVCPSLKCPIFAIGEGTGKDIKKAYREAFQEAHSKIPQNYQHQHHGQGWCREGNQKPFFYC